MNILRRRRHRTSAVVASFIVLGLAVAPATAFNLRPEPPANRLTMNLDLNPSAPFQTRGYGTQSFNSLAQIAIQTWNDTGVGVARDANFFTVQTPRTIGDPCRRDGINEVRFEQTICGLAWGDALGVTRMWKVGGKIVEADVTFNGTVTWDAYPGRRITGIRDFFRVVLHEFGHAAGLNHPDDAGQTVVAIMNARISDVDRLQLDDVTGVHSVFWGPPVALTQAINTSSLEQFVTRFYQTVFGRTPAPSEIADWVSFLTANAHLGAASAFVHTFFDGAEYRNRPVTTATHVALLYTAILGRDPDPAGASVWADKILGSLNSGVTAFVSSQEFLTRVPDVGNRAAATTLVTRLYREALGRTPASVEISNWTDYLAATRDASTLVSFFSAPEYVSIPRTLAQHVTTLFRALLGRDPAPGEVNAWVEYFAGQLGQVEDAFVTSAEFQARFQSVFQ